MPEAVTVIGKGQVIYPNAFAPNVSGPTGGWYNPNDKSNEIFFPYHDGVIEFELFIYNRWGELVFETTDINQGWDGWCGSQRCTGGDPFWLAFCAAAASLSGVGVTMFCALMPFAICKPGGNSAFFYVNIFNAGIGQELYFIFL